MQIFRCALRAAVAAWLVAGGYSLAAGDWPQFRGADSSGVLEIANPPERWTTNANVVWSVPLPGVGWSSPVQVGNRIYVTAVRSEGTQEIPKKGLYFGGERLTPPKETHHWLVLCLELSSGKVLWEKEVHAGPPSGPVHLKNNHAAETPVADMEGVYAYFGNTGLWRLDPMGNVVWKKQWPPYKTRYGWGTAASPVLHDKKLFIVNDNEERSSLTALDAKTGQELWTVDRAEASNWATPYVWKNQMRTEIVVPGRGKVRSYDLSGKELWSFGGMSSIVIPTPFSRFNLLYVASGYVGDKVRPIFAIKPGASGDISLGEEQNANEYIAWREKTAGPYNPSPIVYGDHLYVLFDRGLLSCHDAKTGKVIYDKERLNRDGAANFTASPWAAGGKIYCLSEEGDTYVVQAGPEFKLLAKNPLEEMCMATPAIVPSGFLIRTMSRLYSIGSRK